LAEQPCRLIFAPSAILCHRLRDKSIHPGEPKVERVVPNALVNRAALSLLRCHGRGAGVGRGLGDGPDLGVGVTLGVEVGVGVGVALTVAVGVGVAVGVTVGVIVAVGVGVGLAVGVGVGVGPPDGETRT
jgi:hypothetical protein